MKGFLKFLGWALALIAVIVLVFAVGGSEAAQGTSLEKAHDYASVTFEDALARIQQEPDADTNPSLGEESTEDEAEPTAQPTPAPQDPQGGSEGEGTGDYDVDFEVNLDDDAQFCNTVCTWDIGVNEYETGETAQVGYAWGETVSWDGNSTTGAYALVILQPGFYQDITVKNGGVFVYNVPEGYDEAFLEALTLDVASQVLSGKVAVPAFGDIAQWKSDRESVSGSAQGTAGVGEGLEHPQLDGQEFSCSPENSPCEVDITIGAGQIGLVFGVQIEYGELAGPATDDFIESTTDPEYRCDLVVLSEGTYKGLVINDGRVEVYNLPAEDIEGWASTLPPQRANEQAVNYTCPKWEEVEIWSPSGEIIGFYEIDWSNPDAPTSRATFN